jgi:hypothetical protein
LFEEEQVREERDFEFQMSGTEFLAWLSRQEPELRRSTIGVPDLAGTGFELSSNEWWIMQKYPPSAWCIPTIFSYTIPGVAVTWTGSGDALVVHTRCESAKYAGVYAQLVVLLERLEAGRGPSAQRERLPLSGTRAEVVKRAELAMKEKRKHPDLSYQGAVTRLERLRDQADQEGQDIGIGTKDLTKDDIRYACDKMRKLEGDEKWPAWGKGAKAY